MEMVGEYTRTCEVTIAGTDKTRCLISLTAAESDAIMALGDKKLVAVSAGMTEADVEQERRKLVEAGIRKIIPKKLMVSRSKMEPAFASLEEMERALSPGQITALGIELSRLSADDGGAAARFRDTFGAAPRPAPAPDGEGVRGAPVDAPAAAGS